MRQRGDELLEHICAGGNDSTAHDLLKEFFMGYPLEKLRRLLRSHDEVAAKAGIWIASELGSSFEPLLDEVPRLLDHPMKYVRFFVVDVVLVNATAKHGELLAKTVMLIRDPEEAVRWKVLRLLVRASHEQLTAAVPHLNQPAVSARLDWLLDAGRFVSDGQEIVAELSAPDAVTRMFAVAAAARLGPHDQTPLEHAAASTDHEVNSFAKEELNALKAIRSRPK